MDVTGIEELKYREYRHPKLESFVKMLVCNIEFTSMVAFMCILKILCGWIISGFIVFWYFFLVQMTKHSIYFYDDKGLGPGLVTIAAEDIVRSLRNLCFVAVIAFMWLSAIEPCVKNVYSGKVTNESNTESRDQHSQQGAESGSNTGN